MQLSRDELLDAYRAMRTIRAFEEGVHRENPSGDIPGFIHLCAGQEAVAVGVCRHLVEGDYMTSTHRGHGHTIAMGSDPVVMMKEIFGREGGLCGGKGGSMHLADIDRGMLGANGIVGGGAPIAVGAALAAQTLESGGVAVCFLGDGASNEGAVFEAMNLAVVLKLPCVFVYENNGFGEFTGHDYAVGSHNIATRAAGFGMPAERLDGTDFFTVDQAAREAITLARAGTPNTLEFLTHRHFGHFEGDPQVYRDLDAVKVAVADDCLIKFRRRMEEAALLTAEQLDAVDREAEALIETAVTEARAAGAPPLSALTQDVYVSY